LVFEIYRSGYLAEPAEREQMKKIVHYLEKEFSSRQGKCVLIIEPSIPEHFMGRIIPRKPDAIIIKDNVFCIIEMKGFHGDIIADCSRGSFWKSKDGRSIQSPMSNNPFRQIQQYRRALLDFLLKQFSSEIPKHSKSKEAWPPSNVHSWVVTGEASRPEIEGISQRKHPYFKVLPLEQLTDSLSLLRSEPILDSNDIENLLSELEAEKCTKEEWYRSLHLDQIDQTIGLIPKITQWMDSEDDKKQLKAIRLIYELELKQHRPHVLRSWQNSNAPITRQEALFLLLNWQDREIGSILNEALHDKTRSIVEFSLDYLAKYGYPETFITLTEMLKRYPKQEYPKIIKAISSSGHPDSCSYLYDFAVNTLFNAPFKQTHNILENARALASQDRLDDEIINEYSVTLQEETRISDFVIGIIRSFGDLQCKKSIQWLMEILMQPTSLGFETDNYTELEQNHTFYYVFEAACIALGKIGINNETFSFFLLEKVISAPEDYQYYFIDLLGSLEVSEAIPMLQKLLDTKELRIQSSTATALSKIGSFESFEILERVYVSNPGSSLGRITGKALWRINREWFVDLLLNQINSETVIDDFKHTFLQALSGSASLRCADTLFPLLSNERLTHTAAWILSHLIHDDSIFDRALKLTYSEDPIEQSSAMWVLEKHFIAKPFLLERFETYDSPIEVRRTVAYLYLDSNSKEKLINFVEDPDQEVRDIVFRYFLDRSMVGEYAIAREKRKTSKGNVATDGEFLAVNLKTELLLISINDIIESVVSTHGKDTFGLYLVAKDSDEKYERLLAVPTRTYYSGHGKSKVEQLQSYLKTKSLMQTREDDYPKMKNLWAKIMDFLS
jgi:HEAT repeat protein